MGAHYLPLFQAVISHIIQHREWVVLVTPKDSPYAKGFRSFGLGLLPAGTYFTGRTACFESGGRISVVELPHAFEDVKGPFSVMLLGFGGENLTPKEELELARWRKRAKTLLTLGPSPGELRIH